MGRQEALTPTADSRVLTPEVDSAYRVGYTRLILLCAALSVLLGLGWCWAYVEVRWGGFPPDPASALIIGASSGLFFLTYALPVMRRPLRFGSDFIDLPTPFWKPRIRLALTHPDLPRITLYGTRYGTRAVANGFVVDTQRGRSAFPLPFGSRGSDRLRLYVADMEERGKISLAPGLNASVGDRPILSVRARAAPATMFALGFVVLIIADLVGVVSGASAASATVLLFVALNASPYIAGQRKLARRWMSA